MRHSITSHPSRPPTHPVLRGKECKRARRERNGDNLRRRLMRATQARA